MTNETFELDGIEYGIGLNEERNPYIFRLDGGLIHKQKPIIRKVLEQYGQPVESGDPRTTHQLIRELSKLLGGKLEEAERENNVKNLNAFIADSDCLNELYDYVNDVNIFDILKLGKHEIRHSNMLAWLLNPNENHGLGDYFLKQMLFEAVETNELEIMNKLRPIDIDLMDFDDALIYREKDHIDILVVSERNKLVFAIENKIDSSEHSNQLNRYLETLQRNYPENYHFVLVYLTPDHEANSNPENWVDMDYLFVKEQLEKVIANHKLGNKVKQYIQDYIIVLRRNVVEDKEIKEICAKIYKKHRAALDLIFDNKPDIRNIVSEYIENHLIEVADKYDIFVWENDWSSSFCRFLPKSLIPYFEKKGEGWCSYGLLVGFEFYMPAAGAVSLSIVIGPSNEEHSAYRQKVLDIAVNNPEYFNVKKSTLSAKWKHIDNFTICKKIEELAGEDDEDSIDFDKKIGKRIDDYLEHEMPAKIKCLLEGLSK